MRDLPTDVRGEILDMLGHEAAARGLDCDGTPNRLGRELDELAEALGLERDPPMHGVDAALSSRLLMRDEERCEATRRNGTPCRGRPLAASRFCFFHDPGRAMEREAGFVEALEARAARQLRRLLVGRRCPRCASPDVELTGEPPNPSTCRVCGYRF